MFAIASAICFAVALILHLVGGSHAGMALDFLIGGALALALHAVFDWRPWGRPPAA